jgi:hypothetical protein
MQLVKLDLHFRDLELFTLMITKLLENNIG